MTKPILRSRRFTRGSTTYLWTSDHHRHIRIFYDGSYARSIYEDRDIFGDMSVERMAMWLDRWEKRILL